MAPTEHAARSVAEEYLTDVNGVVVESLSDATHDEGNSYSFEFEVTYPRHVDPSKLIGSSIVFHSKFRSVNVTSGISETTNTSMEGSIRLEY